MRLKRAYHIAIPLVGRRCSTCSRSWISTGSREVSCRRFEWIRRRYYDGQSNDARLSAIITRTAIDQGATAVNYMEVVDLLHSPCEEHKKSHPHELVHGVRVRDKQTDEEFDIHAAMTVNATLRRLHSQDVYAFRGWRESAEDVSRRHRSVERSASPASRHVLSEKGGHCNHDERRSRHVHASLAELVRFLL